MKAYFSCGAGDFIAMESFMTLQEKQNISEFALFTRAAETISDLISLHPIWKNRKIHICMTPEEILGFGVYAFYSIRHLKTITGRDWPILQDAIDISGEVFYPGILSGVRKFRGSGFEVTPCNEPDICVIDSESHADDRLVKLGRNLTSTELAYVKQWIHSRSFHFVEVGVGKTTVKEALSWVAGCKEFYGVDSMLAAWAARQEGIEKIEVKSVNPVYRRWLPIYDPLSKIKVRGKFI